MIDMHDFKERIADLSPAKHDLPEQGMRGVRIKPANSFVEFTREEIDQSIARRFEQQVRKYSHRVAVKSGGQTVTYGELNRLANRIAHTVLSQQSEKEGPVALLIEQGVMMIAAILGVLKTGKIYVPLDPSYPSTRTSRILADSEAELIITNSRNVSLAKALDQKGLSCINIDRVDAAVSSENLALPISPEAYANILYTSGSTGLPKGVVQTHRNLLHDVRHYTNTLAISSADRMTLLYSCSVHGSVRGIFGALLNGASLYPLSIRDEGLDGLADLLINEEITIYHSVPTIFRYFAMTLRGDERLPSLRVIRFGGDRVLAKDIELCRKHFSSDCIICTGLGTSETAHVTQYLIDNGKTIPGGVIPVGYPVEDMEILLLDEMGKEVDFGIVGELAVRSPYLFPGYWLNPALSEKAFLADPSGEKLRIYRTGDLGRRHSDGCIDLVGRTDFQIKIRGFRVEVAEIEAVLLELDCVRETVVHAWEDGTGENRLAAYIVPRRKERPTLGDLRDFLKKRLPDTMIPDSFIILDALPLTPNGKIDRKALPAPESGRADMEESFVSPRTPIEEMLAGIWCDVLGLKKVGIHDNFFELGGHSLLATQVMSRLRNVFHVEIPLRSLFENPTIAGLTLRIAQSQALDTEPEEMNRLLAELEISASCTASESGVIEEKRHE
jgi:amino acid adenylation domain-containing protein